MNTFLSVVAGILLTVFISLGGMGCLSSKEPSKLFQKTDAFYEIMKLTIVDPEIKMVLSPDQLFELTQIESSYKQLRDMALAAEFDDVNKLLMAMAQCGIDICDILEELDVDANKVEEIRAMRIVLKLFIATIPLLLEIDEIEVLHVNAMPDPGGGIVE